MNWNSSWGNAPAAAPPVNPNHPSEVSSLWDNKGRDEVLMEWQRLKKMLSKAKEAEMEFRKYVVKRAFPTAEEGTNTLELGNGYELKAVVKFNYKLGTNDEVEKGLDAIGKIGNYGPYVADRLVSWTPNFLLSEYRTLQEEADKGSGEARAILKEVEAFLTITDAAPTLDIKAPKGKK